jgi:hypothetical protein
MPLGGNIMKMPYLGLKIFLFVMAIAAVIVIWQLDLHQTGGEYWKWLFVKLIEPECLLIDAVIAALCAVFFLTGAISVVVSQNTVICTLSLILIGINAVACTSWWIMATEGYQIQSPMILIRVCTVINSASVIVISKRLK